MHTLIQEFRSAGRGLRRRPVFTGVAVLTLALGIGANTAVFTVVNAVLLRPLRFPEPERLFLISNMPRQTPLAAAPGGLTERHYLEFRRYDKLFESIATFSSYPMIVTGSAEPVRVPAASVTPDFFAVVRVGPAMGRTFLSEEDQPGRDHVALLSDKLWRSRFGADPKVLGSTIVLEGLPHTVVGVMPAGFSFPSEAEVWTPLGIRIDPRNTFLRPVVGRLKPLVSRAQAQSELEAFAAASPPADGEYVGAVTPRVIPLKELLVADIRKSLLIFLGAVAFVLLIACANVANLLLMRAASRQKEIAVRAALGAGRWLLIRHLLAESTLIALAGGAAGLLLALWGVPLLVGLAPIGKIPRLTEIHVDGWVLGFTFGVSLLAGIGFGIVPAVHTARRGFRGRLSPGSRSETGRHERLRSALVVSEIALALVLVTGAGLMLRSFLRLRAVDPGFRPENVLTMTVDLPPAVYRTSTQMHSFHARTLAQLSSIPGVVAAGAVNWLPFGRALIVGDFQLEGGRTLPQGYLVDKMSVSPGYFRSMGIGLLSGRDFAERDNATAPGAVIISQSVARQLWPGEESGRDALGKRISMADHPQPGDWLTVVGVVGDIRQEELAKRPDAAIYQPYRQVAQQFFLNHMTFAVRTDADPRRVAAAMRGVLHEVDKDQPAPPIATMTDVMATVTAEPRFQTRLLGGFSFLALVLAAIGVYGVIAYSVTERTPEIGIRMALGAGRSDVLGMVLRRTLALAGAGVALGTAGALAVTPVLAKFLFEVTPTDPLTFVAVAVLLAAVALVAGWLPARRASKVDPLVALRYE